MTNEPTKTGASLARGKSKQNYSTPKNFIDAVERRFGPLACDLAAEPLNAQADFFYTRDQDSLTQKWRDLKGNLWLNPEFSDIEPWAIKCASESALGAPPILLLTPASVGANWFKQWVLPSAHVIALNGRLCFVKDWETAIDPASVKRGDPHFYKTEPVYPKDCILSVFWADLTGFSTWSWQK